MDIVHAVRSYKDFKKVYGEKSFSNGIRGVLICNCGHIVFALIITVILIILIKRHRRSIDK